MNQDFSVQIMHQAIITTLMLSLPTVGIGLIVGFIISLFQAVTQIQEQTLTFVPKVVAVFLMLAFTFPWMSSILISFTATLWNTIPNMVR